MPVTCGWTGAFATIWGICLPGAALMFAPGMVYRQGGEGHQYTVNPPLVILGTAVLGARSLYH